MIDKLVDLTQKKNDELTRLLPSTSVNSIIDFDKRFKIKGYVNISIPANGGTVTAPASGIMMLTGSATKLQSYEQIRLFNGTYGDTRILITGTNVEVSVPCYVGDVIRVYYSTSNQKTLRLYYFGE